MDGLRFLADRTAVLFLGLAAGAAIGFAFGSTGASERPAVVAAPEAAPVQDAGPATVPPPPAAPAAPATEPDERDVASNASVAEAPAAAVAGPAPEMAAVADKPSTTLVDAAHGARPVRVGVFGDSFGDGVWSGLYRLLPAKDGYQVTKYSQQSTGFTRYRSLNLEEHDDGQIGTTPIDIAVVSFGANDVQGVCDGGHCGALMTPYWQEVIGRRMESYVAMLRRHGASVYWIGLPAMRDAAFDSDTAGMEAFYAATMRRLGVPFIEIRPMTVDASGHYEAYYQDADGTSKLLRAGDGVHMSMNGYIRITKGLAGRIRATVDAARKSGAGNATPSPQVESDGA